MTETVIYDHSSHPPMLIADDIKRRESDGWEVRQVDRGSHDTLGHTDGDLFPGRVREWEDE